MTAAREDRAAIRVHDIGLRIHEKDGQTGFEVLVGGGMGRTPYLGQTICAFLPAGSLLGYLQAVLRVYNAYGRRDNKYKARIKILVNALGIDAFRDRVEEEWQAGNSLEVDLPEEELERIRAYFAPPAFEDRAGDDACFRQKYASEPEFAKWVDRNTAAHKAPGYRIVNVSLKHHGDAPGDISDTQMELVADLAEAHSFDEVRATHEQNLCLPHVLTEDLYAVWKKLESAGLATPNIALASDIIACPGLDYCTLANTRSIPIAQQISKKVRDSGAEEEIGELKIKISGCINACGHHHVGHIGILGVDKKGEEFYQILLGGSATEDASLGQITGRALSADDTLDALDRLIEFYRQERRSEERFLETYRRVGLDRFKGVIYDMA